MLRCHADTPLRPVRALQRGSKPHHRKPATQIAWFRNGQMGMPRADLQYELVLLLLLLLKGKNAMMIDEYQYLIMYVSDIAYFNWARVVRLLIAAPVHLLPINYHV